MSKDHARLGESAHAPSACSLLMREIDVSLCLATFASNLAEALRVVYDFSHDNEVRQR